MKRVLNFLFVILLISSFACAQNIDSKVNDALNSTSMPTDEEIMQTLEKFNFSGMHLEGFIFENANLEKADFTGANLKGANFKGAEVEKVKFDNANLENATFENADLEDASFLNANITNTCFKNAELEYATWTNGEICGAGSVTSCW